MQTRRIALLISSLPKAVFQQDLYCVLGETLPSIVSLDDNPEAEPPVLLISAVHGDSANMLALEGLYRKHYDAIDVFTAEVLLQCHPLEFHRGWQLDAELKSLSSGTVQRTYKALFSIFEP
jgi:hypothetical protein